jgi:hypothetical protein
LDTNTKDELDEREVMHELSQLTDYLIEEKKNRMTSPGITQSPASAYSNHTCELVSYDDSVLADSMTATQSASKGKLKKPTTARNTSSTSDQTATVSSSNFKNAFAMSTSNVNSARYFTISASAGQKFRQIIKKYV